MSPNGFLVTFQPFAKTKRLKGTFKELKGSWHDREEKYRFPIDSKEKLCDYLNKEEPNYNITEYFDDYFELDSLQKKIFNLRSLADLKYRSARECWKDCPNQFDEKLIEMEKKYRFEAEQLQKEADFLESKPLSKSDEAVLELNKKHGAIHISSFWILTEKDNDFTLETVKSFLETYANQKIQIDEGKFKTKAEIWLASPNRRTFDGIVFDPSNKPINKRLYNIWKGLAKKAQKGISIRFWEHVFHIICCNNEEYYWYIRKWLALLIQRPEEIPQTAIILKGCQGIGKGIFVEAIGKLLGDHYVHLDNIDRLLQNFNSHLKYAVLVYADEVTWKDSGDVGKIKYMITEPDLFIEQKGKDPIRFRNFRHFIFSTNADVPIHLEARDRRFITLNVSDDKQGDHAYFDEMLTELKSGGYEAILHDLLIEDIKDFNPRSIPKNNEAFDIKILCANTAEQYIYYALKDSCFDLGNPSPNGFWKTSISKRSVYDDYVKWCDYQKLKPKADNVFGKTIRKLIKSSSESRPTENQIRTWYYNFANLEVSKSDFQKYFKTTEEIWS